MSKAVIFVALVLTGCVSVPELKPGAESILIVASADRVDGCRSLGMVYGYSDNGFKGYGGRGGVSQQHSMFDAQNKAYALGANRLLIVNSNSRIGGTDTTAEAFKCGY